MTIKDVSKSTGLSVATISRVINNSTSVTQKTREKVMQVIRETGYVQNALGRNLRTADTKTIFVCVQSIENPYYSEIIRSIEEAASESGYFVWICESYSKMARYQYFADAVKSKKADGIIILSPSSKDVLDCFVDTPFVVCGETDETYMCDTININNEQSGYEVVKHIIELGAKNIAFASGMNRSAMQRKAGYERALKEFGLKISDDLQLQKIYSYEEAYSAVSGLLDKGIQFDGLFAATDILATGAVNALLSAKKRIPEDIKVAGFDDMIFAKISAVPITTVRQPRKQMGTIAFEILYEKIKNGNLDKYKQIVLDHELIIRSSTK